MLNLLKGTNSLIRVFSRRIVKPQLLDPNFYFRLLEDDPSLGEAANKIMPVSRGQLTSDGFQLIWKKYCYFVVKTYERNKEKSNTFEDKLKYLQTIVLTIDSFGKEYFTAHISKICNKLSSELLSQLTLDDTASGKPESIRMIIHILNLISRYNKKKTAALFIQRKTQFWEIISKLTISEVAELLYLMKQSECDDALIRERVVEYLYRKLEQIKPKELIYVMKYLAWTNKFINRELVIKIGVRLLQFFHSQACNRNEIANTVFLLAKIEDAMKANRPFVADLNRAFEVIMSYLAGEIKRLPEYCLKNMITALRYSAYHDETILNRLIYQAMSREVVDFLDETYNYKSKVNLGLLTLIDLLHLLARQNYKHKEFKEYFLKVLQLAYEAKTDDIFRSSHRIIWSLCVLFQPQQLAPILPFIAQVFSQPNGANFYFCNIYLQLEYPKLAWTHSEPNLLAQTITWNHERVYNALLELGVICLKEHSIREISVDIFIPQWHALTDLVIEVNGYHHFMRNCRKHDGGVELRKKILQQLGYSFHYVSIDDLEAAPDLKLYMEQFLQHLEDDLVARDQHKATGPKQTEIGRLDGIRKRKTAIQKRLKE